MKSRFIFQRTSIEGVLIVERAKLGDRRGFLERLFCAEEFSRIGWREPIAQINHTLTSEKGTIRGMHFQEAPYAEKKLIVCLRGSILDVAVDLREGSRTMLMHHKEVLSSENNLALLIPEGCAHGFQALSDDVELVYLHSNFFHAEMEGGVSPVDPRLAIDWPLPFGSMSDRDHSHPPITPNYKGLRL